MNPLQKELNEHKRAMLDLEIERMAREQNVKPFNFKEAFGEGRDIVTAEEIEDLLQLRRELREIEQEEIP